ncbi:putative glucose 1-dehydrogenase (NAD(P)(+)) [Helianthus debilis subsp. tardiflorus]
MNVFSMANSTQHATNCELEQWRDLKGMVVMITGASSGIGREFCIDLAKSGCKIIAAARRTDRLKSLCDEINNVHASNGHVNQVEARNSGGLFTAVAVELDVSAPGPAIKESVTKAWSAFGRIDALINNAGMRGPLKSLLDLEEEDWDKTFRTNVSGSWLVSKYVCQQMIAINQEGTIINISSIAAINRVLQHGAVAYTSSKASLNTMTKVM